jgi:hypothetical protein
MCFLGNPRAFLYNLEIQMIAVPYKVCVVVDRNFGERLAALPQGVPVWIVDTPANKPVAQLLWRDRKGTHLTGITTFNDSDSSSSEDLFADQLDTIDLHHGSYSADPPYTQLEVLGAPLTERIRTALSEYGFNEFHLDPEGFHCSRPVPQRNRSQVP